MIQQQQLNQNKLRRHLVLAGLILITLSIFYPPYDWAFIGDDYVQFHYIREALANPWASFLFFNPYYSTWYYRPLQLVWFAFLEGRFHFLPNGYYWVALLFHALAIALVYRVGRQFGLRPFSAVVTTVLFAVHAHWVDVVTWVSSVAIMLGALFSLLSLSAWLQYLKRPSTRLLWTTYLFCLLTFLSHEESILLPPFLLFTLLFTRIKKNRGPWHQRFHPKQIQAAFNKREAFFFFVLLATSLVYLTVQFTRPNLTIDVSSRQLPEWLAFLSWPELAEFSLVTLFRFAFRFQTLALSTRAAVWVVAGFALVLAFWYWRGSRLVRLGLIWLLLHLVFIFWAVWTHLPELYAGRHIYQAMIGLVLAIGGSLDMFFSGAKNQKVARRPMMKSIFAQPGQSVQVVRLCALLLVTAVSLYQADKIKTVQSRWLDDANEEAVVREQLAELYPTLSPNDHFFAVRFPVAPEFIRFVLRVWYDRPLKAPGGSLEQLNAYGQADRDFVVLDYADGQVYNLMPELQEQGETIFLWAQSSERVWLEENGRETPAQNVEKLMTVVEAKNGRQLALKLTPENGRWLSHRLTMTLPANSNLETAILPEPGLRYRLRLQTCIGEEEILLDTTGGEPQEWQPVSIPLGLFSARPVTLLFETKGENLPEGTSGYWANPRLVLD